MPKGEQATTSQTITTSMKKKKARFMNEDIAVGVVYFNFSKAFKRVSCGILLSKLGRYGTDRWAIGWAKSWLYHQAE